MGPYCRDYRPCIVPALGYDRFIPHLRGWATKGRCARRTGRQQPCQTLPERPAYTQLRLGAARPVSRLASLAPIVPTAPWPPRLLSPIEAELGRRQCGIAPRTLRTAPRP